MKKLDYIGLLMKLYISKDGSLPYIDNFLASEKNERNRDLYSYLLFLQWTYEEYLRISSDCLYGKMSFEDYLNFHYPPNYKIKKNSLDKLDDYFREGYAEDDKLSVKTILEIIQDFIDEE